MLEPEPVDDNSISINASCDELEICFLPSAETICGSNGNVNTDYIIEIQGEGYAQMFNQTLANAQQGSLSCITLNFDADIVGIGDFQIRIASINGGQINYGDWLTFTNEPCCNEKVDINITKYVSSCWSTKIQILLSSPADCNGYYDFSFESDYEDCYTSGSQFYTDYPLSLIHI